ncbi:MAG: tetratricopeptide repeat protein [Chitinophagales bacterium]
MIKRILTILLCLSFSTLTVLSQDSLIIDSLKQILEQTTLDEQRLKAYNELAYQFHTSDTSKSAHYAHQALDLSTTLNNTKEKGEAYKRLGLTHGYFGNPQKSVQYYEKAYQSFQSIQDTSAMVGVLNNMGRQLAELGQYEQAIQGYLQAEKWEPISSDSLTHLILKFNHAASLSASLQHQQTIDLCNTTLPLALALNNWYVQMELHNLKGINQTELKDFQAAEVSYSHALQCIPRTKLPTIDTGHISSNPDLVSNILNNRALLYKEQGHYDKAYTDLKMAIKILENENAKHPNGEFYVNLGIVAHKMNKWKESQRYFKEGLKRLEIAQQAPLIGETYGFLADLYEAMGEGMLAYKHLKSAHQLQDSLLSERVQKNLQELNVKYETEKFQHELTVVQLKMQTQQNHFYLLIGCGLALFLLGGIGYYFYYNRQEQRLLALEKKQIELQYGLLRAQMNPHFIFNALNSIHGFFASNQLVRGNEFMAKFSRLVRQILDQSALESHSLTQEIETLRLYLDIEKERMAGDLDYSIQLDASLEADFIELPPLIFQPFVENAVWHGIAPKNKKGHIWIDIQKKDEQELRCLIIDDGVGLQKKSNSLKPKHRSKGIQMARERLRNQGQIEIKDNLEKSGVTVQINLSID